MIAADSGAAILNAHFTPLQVVAASAVLVEHPYTHANCYLAEPIFADVEHGSHLVIHELELCKNLLKSVKADVVHLDMSFRGLSVEELSALSLSRLGISGRVRGHMLKVLPKMRKMAVDIRRVYNVDVLAIGKESIPVRVAELTSGAHAVLYTAERAIKNGRKLYLGLPIKCQAKIGEDGVRLESSMPAERDVSGYAGDEDKILGNVQVNDLPNPCARGFRVLEISPKPR